MPGFVNTLKQFNTKLYGLYKNITSSIAFIPATFSLALVSIAILLIDLYSKDSSIAFSTIPYMEVNSSETARAIFTALLTGIISLTIFSFSMVMLVLNQAAARFSPKVQSSLISNKSNQFVLGLYVGTILYLIVMLMQIRGDEDSFEELPQLALIIGVFLVVLCIVVFVKFINDISLAVEIENVVKRVYTNTHKTLVRDMKHDNPVSPQCLDITKWYSYRSQKCGYLQDVVQSKLVTIAQKHDLVLSNYDFIGLYHSSESPLFRSDKVISDPALIREIEDCFIFYIGEDIEDNVFFGLRQLKEIAAKALSTGMNEPGTAFTCLDYLTDLLIMYTQTKPYKVYRDKKGEERLLIKYMPLEEVLYRCVSPIRIFGKNDPMILYHMLTLFWKISLIKEADEFQDLLKRHAMAVLEDAEESLTNSLDKQYINGLIQQINTSETSVMQLPLLKLH
jgi:uncharacterized membrane protein